MRRFWPVPCALTVLLTGCATGVSGEEGPSTVTVTVGEQPAGTSAAGEAGAMPVPSTGVFASQFDPCEVFSEEQLRRAGLDWATKVPPLPAHLRACGYVHQDMETYRGAFLIATDPISIREVQARGMDPRPVEGAAVEGIYTHRMPGGSRECSAAVDFHWGRFSVDYLETGEGWDEVALCAEPIKVLESLITQSGGTHGTEN